MEKKKQYINKELIAEELRQAGILDCEEIVTGFEKEFVALYKKRIKSLLPYQSEEYDTAESFFNYYSNYSLELLPSWVVENLDNARIVGNAKQTVMLADGRKYQLNNSLNHLSGGEWTYFINSVINTAYKTSGEDSYAHKIRKIHPTPKPPQLMRDIITFFTKEKELVFDYFMGVGGSLLGAALSNRKAIGIELNEKYIDAYKQAAASLNLPIYKTINADCMEFMSNEQKMQQLLTDEKISLVLIDPPYGNMMSRKKTGADIAVYGNVATPFTDSDKDFGNLEIEDFYKQLKASVELIMPYMKIKGHVVLFIKDLQPDKHSTNLLHARIVEVINEISGLNYKGMKIWADQTAKLYPYGYPFSFVANQIHQYILIFRKEK